MEKYRMWFSTILLGLLIVACKATVVATVQPDHTPIAAKVIAAIGDEPLPTQTTTPSPSPTPLPTATPTEIYLNSDPAWLHNESYVLRQEGQGGDPHLVLYPPGNTEGVRLLDGCLMSSSAVSQGRVALIVGASPIRPECSVFDVLDLVLYIVDLPEISAQRILSIVAPLKDTVFPEVPLSDPIAQVFSQISREVPVWSPNGRFLAFVGALEEFNSDLYLYDTQSRAFRRMTDGPNYSSRPIWSADGSGLFTIEKIAETGFLDELSDHGLWWTALNRDVADWMGPDKWPGNRIDRYPIASNSWIARSYGDAPQMGPIYLINPQSSVIEEICPFSFAAGILNQGTSDYMLAYCSYDGEPVSSPTVFSFRNGSLVGSIVLEDLKQDGFYPGTIPVLEEAGVFVISHERLGLLTISTRGDYEVLDGEVISRTIIPSPDGTWLVVTIGPYGRSDGIFQLYSVDDTILSRGGEGTFAIRTEWAPDSSRLLLSCKEGSSKVIRPPGYVLNINEGCPTWRNWNDVYVWSWLWTDAVVFPVNQ